MKVEDLVALLKQNSERRAIIVDVLKELFKIFLKDWFRWEIFGWVLAIFLGFNEDEIMRAPEIGWFAKAAVASVLMQSKKRSERLLGRALLYHTEIPPRRLFVKHGGSLIPAVIYHYRTSAQDEGVLKDAVKIATIIQRRLRAESRGEDTE